LYEIQALIKEIDGVNNEIDKLRMSFFFDDEKLRIRNVLKENETTCSFNWSKWAKKTAQKALKSPRNEFSNYTAAPDGYTSQCGKARWAKPARRLAKENGSPTLSGRYCPKTWQA
jgi:hypothetical protein